jgi:CHAT domain-containing protein
MRLLGYALVVVVCASLSISTAGPKKNPHPTSKAPAGQTAAPGAPKAVDPKIEAELQKLDQEYYKLLGKQAYKESVKVAKQLYDLQVKATGLDSLEVERRRTTLASAYQQAGDYTTSEKIYREQIAYALKKYGQGSRELLQAYQYLSGVLWTTMWSTPRWDELEAVQQHILAATKKLEGEKTQAYASALQSYGQMLQMKNEWGATLRTFEEVLKIYEAIGKPDDWSVVSTLQLVASTYWQMNQQNKAIPLFDRALKLAVNTKDQMLTMRVSTIWTIAMQYSMGGRKDLGAPLFKQAIDMTEAEIARLEKTAADDWQIGSLMSLLGSMHRFNGDYTKAEEAYTRYSKWAAKKGTAYSGMESAIAEIKRIQGKNKEALALYEKARDELAKVAPQSKTAFNQMLSDIHRELGNTAKSVELYEEYRDSTLKQWGKNSTIYGYAQLAGVTTYAAAGKFKAAEAALTGSLDVSEKELQNVLRVGTDTDHAIYFSKYGWVLDTPLNFNLNYQPNSGTASRLALTTVLRRKGRLLDAAAAALATIRQQLSPDDKKLLDELNAARAQLAKLTVAGPGASGDTAAFGKEVAALEDKIQKLEAQVSKKSAAYRTVTQPITLAAVQKNIPKDARLVELVNYQPYDPKMTYAQALAQKFKPRRYLAYVASQKGDPVFVDLGDATPIDKAIEAYRKALADPDNDNVLDLGKALNDLTFAKIVPKLGNATNILIAPDGALNVIPFSALVDDKKEFLIKKYTFTYLTSGRDLLRLQVKTKSQGGGVLFADPKFDDTGGAKSDSKTRGARSMDLATLQWPQLPGTAAEADAIVKSFKGFKVYRGEQATEGTIKQIKGPKILHLATHGFFLPDEALPEADGAGVALAPAPAAPGGVGAGPNPQAMSYENPLLRSGLALAGANKLVSGNDDGLLTALEASGLDLWGTKLVVLSACETGVGKVTNGDGVYGLRRSLIIAGAESLVMSMWQVDDFATKELMTGFYKKLADGKPRSEALRQTQLELLGKKKYAHPFYWAAFLPAGATTPLKD